MGPTFTTPPMRREMISASTCASCASSRDTGTYTCSARSCGSSSGTNHSRFIWGLLLPGLGELLFKDRHPVLGGNKLLIKLADEGQEDGGLHSAIDSACHTTTAASDRKSVV